MRAQGDRHLVWRTLHTRHFDIHYHEPLGLLARHLADRAEDVHARLSSALGLTLRERVNVVLSDGTDSANGSADVLPYNVIRLNAVAPRDRSVLSDYDDWLGLLLTHEHAHILHLDTASGLPQLVRTLLGRVYTPQGSLPRWFIEGLATMEESAQTSAGRLREAQFRMYLRSAALEGRLLDLDWISHDGEPWPHTDVRYLYGSAFLAFVVERHGRDALGRIAKDYGRRLVPYALNRAAKRATGETFVAMYELWKRRLIDEAKREEAAVVAAGVQTGTRRTFHGEDVWRPRHGDDQHVLYTAFDGRRQTGLYELDLTTGKRRRIARMTGGAAPAPVPGTGDLIVDLSAPHRGEYRFGDLYRLSREGSARPRRLTHALRVGSADVSPDGRWIVYSRQAASTSHLEIARLDDIASTRRVLVQSRRLEQVFSPRFSPDGAKVAYSAWSRGGYRDVWWVEVETRVRTRVTRDRAVDRTPCFSPDGSTLYFSSDRTGIANLYAHDLESGEQWQVSNVVGGAFSPDVSPNGERLIYVGYTARGFDLFELPVDRTRWRPAPSASPRPLPRTPPTAKTIASEPYRPGPTLAPRGYELGLSDAAAGTLMTATTNAHDVLGWHAAAAKVGVTLDDGEAIALLGYAMRRGRLPLFVDLGWADGALSGSLGRNARTPTWRLQLGTSVRLPGLFHSHDLGLSYELTFVETPIDLNVRLDPNVRPPRPSQTGQNAWLSASWVYDSTRRQAYDVSRSFGNRTALRVSLANDRLGSLDDDVALTWSSTQYLRLHWQEMVLALRYTGAWSRFVTLAGTEGRFDTLSVLAGQTDRPGDAAGLRGHPARSGENLHVVQLELRALALRINQGWRTLPLFAQRLHVALFVDVGDAYDGPFVLSRLGVGVGGELRLDFRLGYNDGYTWRTGISRGVTSGGELQWYTSIATPF